jgi:hypothetical protein
LLGCFQPPEWTTESEMTSSPRRLVRERRQTGRKLTHDPAHRTRSTCCLPRQPRLEPGQPQASFGCVGLGRARSGALASRKHQGPPQHPWPRPHFLLGAPRALASPGRRPSDASAASLGARLEIAHRTSYRPTASSFCLDRTDQCEQTVSARRHLVTMAGFVVSGHQIGPRGRVGKVV